MPEFRVNWVIDVVAANLSDAAEAARAAQVRAGTLATTFTVAERLPGRRLPGQRYGPLVEVDLEPGDLDKLTALMDSITRADTVRCDHASALRPVDLCRECGAILADGVEVELTSLTTEELPGGTSMTGRFTARRRGR